MHDLEPGLQRLMMARLLGLEGAYVLPIGQGDRVTVRFRATPWIRVSFAAPAVAHRALRTLEHLAWVVDFDLLPGPQPEAGS